MAKQGHSTIVAPALASTPYQYIQPYAVHLDSLAEGGLSKVEGSFPLITEDVGTITGALKGMASDVAWMPFRRVMQAYNYVSSSYCREHERCGGRGIIAGGTAILTFQLAVAGDTLAMLSTVLTRNKQWSSWENDAS